MGHWKEQQLEEFTPISCTGVAKLTIIETGEIFEVNPEDLAWEISSTSDEGMGEECQYQATKLFESTKGNYTVEATWNVWEYPTGVINHSSTEVEGGKLLQDFDSDSYSIVDENFDDNYSSIVLSNVNFYGTFLASIEKIQVLLNAEMPSQIQLPLSQLGYPASSNADVKQYLLGLLYTNAITALETFLSDAFINTVLKNPNLVRKFVETEPKFKKQKFALSKLFVKMEQINDEVKEYLSSQVIWHQLEKIKPMYETTLNVYFPDNLRKIFEQVKIRHDLVHRNGKSKNGDIIKLNQEDIQSLLENIQALVSHLNEQIVNLKESHMDDSEF